MSRQAVFAESILESKALCVRYFAGFDDTNRTKQAPSLPNHFAWNLGHLAYIMQRAAEKLDGKPIPDSDFIIGGHPSGGGDATRFASQSISMGSKPVDDPSQYPSHARCIEIFSAACDRVAAAFRDATDSAMEKDVAWGATNLKAWQLGPRMQFHNGDHIGQIADLRRALGFKSIMT